MNVQTDVALAAFSTMGVGGAARYYVDARQESDVRDALQWAREHDVVVHVLGGGSNIVIADDGVSGLVIHVRIRGVEPRSNGPLTVYQAGAGEPWDPLVDASVGADCAGLECLSGIPGFVGGTPVQNVGAYGQDVSGTIHEVRAVDRLTGETVRFTNPECLFGYRTSRFKRADAGRYVVTSVSFALRPGGAPTLEYADVLACFRDADAAPTLRQVRDAVLLIRRRKGMVIEPGNAANQSCGSFFVNPVVADSVLLHVADVTGEASVPHYRAGAATVKLPAAWLIERAGLPRGTTRGPVGISPFQAQAIINLGGARAGDVLALAGEIKRAVWNTFGITLVPEPVFVGFASSPDLTFLLSSERSH
jgi:UDP-N-acetylmuramate dehydrogenase